MEIVEIQSNKGFICDAILRSLPQWFGIEEHIKGYVSKVVELPMFGCLIEKDVVGFLSLKPHTEFAAEIYVLGVRPDWHRRGIGRRLVQAADNHAKERGIRFITVKTLSPRVEYEPYEKTRRFYSSMGFVPIEEFPNLWGPENPTLMLIRPVKS
jgi:ribosomal protein S18 acetylase RimI-like enzyme